jgi:hypothetical protein
MYTSPSYQYNLDPVYSNHFCVGCKKAIEDNPHFIFQCPAYEDIRVAANDQVNDTLANLDLEQHKNLLKVTQEVRKQAANKGELGLANPVIQAWKGYCSITNTIIGIIANALLEMKRRRNEFLGSETLGTQGT